MWRVFPKNLSIVIYLVLLPFIRFKWKKDGRLWRAIFYGLLDRLNLVVSVVVTRSPHIFCNTLHAELSKFFYVRSYFILINGNVGSYEFSPFLSYIPMYFICGRDDLLFYMYFDFFAREGNVKPSRMWAEKDARAK